MIALNKKFWKKLVIQIALTFCLVILISLFFYWSAQLALNTNTPFITVSTRTMSISNDSMSNSWIHPFERTLQMGDFLIIQGVDPDTLNTNYPNSDIIVFHRPDNLNEKIIHRIVAKTEINGTLYFFTKGDGNTQYKWPNPVDPEYFDQWYGNSSCLLRGAVNQELVEGKVVMRIPWGGYVALFVENARGASGSGDSYVTSLALIILIMPVLLIFNSLNLRRNK